MTFKTTAAMTALTLALALVASPVQASVTFTVTGTYSDGGTLSGTFTTDDALTTVQSTNLTVAGGTGFDSVIFNQASYISAGTNKLPNSFSLFAGSSVDKSLSLFFSSALTLSGATLTSASSNYQEFVGTRTIVSGTVTNPDAVPEPASWAMMLLGFAGIGFAVRRRNAPAPQLA